MIRRQQLTLYGWFMVGLSALTLLATWAAWLIGAVRIIWALLLTPLPLLQLILFGPSLSVTLKFRSAPKAPAVVLNRAEIGVFKTPKGNIHTCRLWIEVQPPDRPMFQTELVLPIKEDHLSRLKQGALLQVKYLPGNPENVLFNKVLDEPADQGM